MASADGSILIRTNVDTTGIKKGTQSIQKGVSGINKSLVKLGATMLSVFSVIAIFNFGKQAIKSASELTNAMIGLKSIVDGTGNSFDRANKFIQEYISDGLVPATNAITAYKNLLMRGYSIDQIEQTMVALKDSSAFGRQASLSLGDAVQSATEGLKNENSILVDNAGVTKNVAKMWEDYAKSIGKSTKDLTKNEKILAEVNGIMEETRFQVGDAAKVAQTWGGQISALNVKWQQFLVLVGGRLIQVLTPVVSFLSNVLTLALKVGDAIANIFGWESATESITGSTASNVADTADSQEDVANATKDTNKALKKQLAFFDDINVLSSETATSGTGASTGTTATTGGGVSVIPSESETEKKLSVLEQKIKSFFENLNKLLQPTIEAFNKLWDEGLSLLSSFTWGTLQDFYNDFLVPISTWTLGVGLPKFIDVMNDFLKKIDFPKIRKALDDLYIALTPFAKNIGEGLLWFLDNILKPIALFVVNDVVPVFLDTLTSVIESLNDAIETVKPSFQYFYDDFLVPLGEWTGEFILSALEFLSSAIKDIADVFAGVVEYMDEHSNVLIIVTGLFTGLAIAILANVIAANALTISAGFTAIAIGVYNVAVGIAVTITGALSAVIGFLTSPITLVILAITALVTIIVLLVKNWDSIKETASNVWASVVEIWGAFATWFSNNVWEPFKEVIGNMADGFESIFTGLWEIVKGVINLMIGGINTMLDGFVAGINFVVDAVNNLSFDIPDWVPVIGGETWGISIPNVKSLAIPKLAQGGVIPPNSEFMAILGDQKSGVNIETPLSTMVEAFNTALGSRGGSSNGQTIVLNIDGQTFARVTLDNTLNEMNRQGYDVAVIGG